MQDARATPDPTLGIEGLSDIVPLGSGGAATVYRARQISFDRPVAVKLLTAPIADGAARARFEREQQLTGRLTGHPNIARVFDAGFSSLGQPYLVMEYYAGGTLRDAVISDGPQDAGTVLETGVKLAGALATAHAAGILHRDIKPANVLLDQFGEPHLADFGISGMADHSADLTHAYTTRYAAPEVLARVPVYSPAADQYSLALTLLYLLTGQPGSGDNPLAELANTAGIPQPLRSVLARALADDSGGRFATTADMGAALQQAQRILGEAVTPLRVVDAADQQAPPPRAFSRATHESRPSSNRRYATGPGSRETAPEVEDESATRLRGPVPAPAQPAQPPRKRLSPGLLIGAAIAFALIVIAGAFVGLVFNSGGGTAGTSSEPALDGVHAPTNVQVRVDSPTSVTVTWSDTNDGQVAYTGFVVATNVLPSQGSGQASGMKEFVIATNKGATTATVPGLPPGVGRCALIYPIVAGVPKPELEKAGGSGCAPSSTPAAA